MVQNLNNNLITAPELSGLRKRLRNLDTRVTDPSAHIWMLSLTIGIGGPDVLCGFIQVLVSQFCLHIFTVSACTSI